MRVALDRNLIICFIIFFFYPSVYGLNYQEEKNFDYSNLSDSLQNIENLENKFIDPLNFDFSINLDSISEDKFILFLKNLNDCKDRELKDKAVRNILDNYSSDSVKFHKINKIAFDYLYNLNSPGLNEESYIPFLRYSLNSPLFDNETKSRNEFYLRMALKNRIGDKASDFKFHNLSNESFSLYDFTTNEKDFIILLFYDPNCENCINELGRIKEYENKLIALGQIYKIITIYSGEDYDEWRNLAIKFPDNWIAGYNSGNIIENDIYYFNIFPTYYILNGEMTILGKDVNPEIFFNLKKVNN